MFKKLQKSYEKLSSSEQQIIAFDKLYHNILLELGYTGTFGEILKKKPKHIKNLDEIWRLHKIRNSLVHELGTHKNLESDAKKYSSLITNLLLKNRK